VLLDYYAYAQAHDISYQLVGKGASHAISLAELKAVAAWQHIELQIGDLLFVRSGFWVGYNALSDQDKLNFANLKPETWVGVETSRDVAKWLWETGVVSGAGDAPGWEKIPNYNSPPEAGLQGKTLHEIMLGGWGMPIGEMFDLEVLSEQCKKHGRYSFFVTSAPLHVKGGVGSPPNAIAIF
jgi:kynurenine formamidase